MLSKSDVKMVEKVLCMTDEQRDAFIKKLGPGEQGYLSNIIDQYEKTLD